MERYSVLLLTFLILAGIASTQVSSEVLIDGKIFIDLFIICFFIKTKIIHYYKRLRSKVERF